ncbi:MAG: nicotinate (nicotinamide) nucleotide adenylyltransferase [archaeon]
MRKSLRVGLLGGSFNPIHNSHIKLIHTVLQRKLVDEVWIIPCKKHAFGKELTSAKHRVAMLKLAFKGMRGVHISSVELTTQDINYTYRTIALLEKRYPFQFSFIIGSDLIKELPDWKYYGRLLRKVHFLVFHRQGFPVHALPGMHMTRIHVAADNISSRRIRQCIAAGKKPEHLPAAVSTYIRKHGLYAG